MNATELIKTGNTALGIEFGSTRIKGVLIDYDGNMLYASLDAIEPHAPVTREQAAATLCRAFKSLGILAY